MKQYVKKHLVNFIVAGALVVLIVACQIACTVICSEPDSQTLSTRWGATDGYNQLSVFFSEKAGVTTDSLSSNERSIHLALDEASVLPNGNERLMISAYSTIDTVSISSEMARGESVRLVAVSGDFFKFHPYELISGSYFDDFNDENGDGLIIDSLVAWRLFGGMDCAGLTVDVAGRAYPIRGVVRADDERFSETVGEGEATVFMSFEAYKRLQGENVPNIQNYEILLKNPIANFAENTVKTAFGGGDNAAENWDKDLEIVNNTTRYRFGNRVMRLGGFFTQTMNTKLISYPYWENRARGYEQIGEMLTLIQLMLLVYPVFCLICLIIKLVSERHTVARFVKEKKESLVKKYHAMQAERWLRKNAPTIEENTSIDDEDKEKEASSE